MFIQRKEHIRNDVLYEFHIDVNASAAAKPIGIRCVEWKKKLLQVVSRYKTLNFCLEDEPKDYRWKGPDSEYLEADPVAMAGELIDTLNVIHTRLEKDWNGFSGCKICHARHVSKESPAMCRFLRVIAFNLKWPFLDTLVTGDEKNGSFAITLSAVVIRSVRRNHTYIATDRRSCWVYGGLLKGSSIIIC